MSHNRYQVDTIVAHCARDFRRRLALDDYRLNFQPGEQWISKQIEHVSPQLQQLMIERTPVKRVFDIDSGHSPFLSQPEALTRALLEAARG